MSWATCHTEDCANEGAPIDVGELRVYDDVEGVWIEMGVSCGVCGEPITDISDAPPEPPPEPKGDG
jgi:hypothetical protein